MDSALAKRMAQQAAKAAGDGSDDDDDDDVQACDNYRVDLQAKNFGDCKCGFPKFSHKEKPKPVGRAAFQKKQMHTVTSVSPIISSTYERRASYTYSSAIESAELSTAPSQSGQSGQGGQSGKDV